MASRRRAGPAAIATVLLVAACGTHGGGAAGPAPTPATSPAVTASGTPPASAVTDVPTTVDALTPPVYISHRGGASFFPEESMEGFTASARAGFLPEMDVRALKDGTLVLLHDSTVDRTMTGVHGPVDQLTLDQWQHAWVKPARPGGQHARPATWDEVLDRLGGTIVLVPEIKVTDPDDVDAFIHSITSRHLEQSVIVQSFSFDVCKQMHAAGLHTLFLMSNTDGPAPAEIKQAGIEYAGPAKDIDPGFLQQLVDAGLKVVPWTVDKPDVARSLLHAGVFGVFTDNAWLLSGTPTPKPSRR